MDTQTLMTVQAEALAKLVSLMHIDKDDPRPQKVLTTIRLAAMAILRLKPSLSRAATDDRPAARAGSGEDKPTQPPQSNPTPAPDHREADLTAHLTDDQFAELLQHLPDTLDPATDKRRLRLARYLARFNLGVTPEVKTAIRARAQSLAESLRQQRAA